MIENKENVYANKFDFEKYASLDLVREKNHKVTPKGIAATMLFTVLASTLAVADLKAQEFFGKARSIDFAVKENGTRELRILYGDGEARAAQVFIDLYINNSVDIAVTSFFIYDEHGSLCVKTLSGIKSQNEGCSYYGDVERQKPPSNLIQE